MSLPGRVAVWGRIEAACIIICVSWEIQYTFYWLLVELGLAWRTQTTILGWLELADCNWWSNKRSTWFYAGAVILLLRQINVRDVVEYKLFSFHDTRRSIILVLTKYIMLFLLLLLIPELIAVIIYCFVQESCTIRILAKVSAKIRALILAWVLLRVRVILFRLWSLETLLIRNLSFASIIIMLVLELLGWWRLLSSFSKNRFFRFYITASSKL
jgi:hypothetical protein